MMLVLILILKNRTPKALNLAKHGNISILVIFCRPFLVTIATVKVKRMSEIYNWVILLINQLDEIGEKQLLFFVQWGGGGAYFPH